MIISHRLKYIFVHIPKTGGTSIRNLLFDDVFQFDEQGCWEELTTEEVFYKLNRNVFIHDSISNINKYLEKTGYNNKEYYKFAFIRNPWDLAVSLYEYYRQYMSKICNVLSKKEKKFVDDANVSFKKFVIEGAISQKSEWIRNMIIEEEKLLVNFIGKFENMQDDMFKITKTILPDKKNINFKIPHLNYTIRKKYKEYYDNSTKKFVENAFNYMIDLGNYKF